MSMNKIAEQMAAARNMAAQVVLNEPAPEAIQALPAIAARHQAPMLTLDDALAGGAAADAYLSVGLGGMLVKQLQVKEIHGTIAISDIVVLRVLRYKVKPGDSYPVYLRSYDGASEIRSGSNWIELIREAKLVDASCLGDYVTFDVPIVLTQDLESDGTVVAEAGMTLGHTPSVMNAKEFTKVLATLTKTYSRQAVIEVKLTIQPVTTTGKPKWNKLVVEILSVVDPAAN